MDAAEAAADRFLAAVRGGPEKWALAAISQPPWAARGDFTAMLDGVALRLRARVVESPQQNRATLRRYLTALRKVENTRWDAQGNLNPHSLLESRFGDRSGEGRVKLLCGSEIADVELLDVQAVED